VSVGCGVRGRSSEGWSVGLATVEQRFDRRRNNFDSLRLFFAGLVAVAHGIAIHTGDQPQWGASTLGDFGLDGFFILSGFLVTRSYLSLGSLPRFSWHRLLRIMPAFWVLPARRRSDRRADRRDDAG
jgi:peptidoglycan/LPS O-acetylase OafA/YrhL